jgi:hypothetical protein
MKTEDADFLDWLHDERREAEADRKRRGISGADYLRECAREAARVRDELGAQPFVVRDKPADPKDRKP